MENLQGQLFILLYTAATVSGIVAAVRFHTLLATQKLPLYRSYLHFLYSYSVMILSALGVVYVEANIQKYPQLTLFFQAGVVLSSFLLAYSLPAFLKETVKSKDNKRRHTKYKTKHAWSLQVLFVCDGVLFYFSPGAATLVGLAIFFTAFAKAMRLLFQEKRSLTLPKRMKKRILFFASLGSLSLILELVLHNFAPHLNRYSLTMPLLYLLWNMLSFSLIQAPDTNSKTLPLLFDLTPQEQRIVQLIETAKSNKEIAELLHISPHTVKNHITNILRKTSTTSRMELVNLVRADV